MTDHKIIRRAVDKASKNGYTGWKSFVPAFPPLKVKSTKKLEELIDATLFLHKEKIVFSHSFAKYYWGEKNWRFHLQELVISKDRLRYLKKYL